MGRAVKMGGPPRRCVAGSPEVRPVAPARRQPDTTTYAGRVAVRLRELRERKGWTVKQAAEHLGIKSDKTLYSYEDGSRELSMALIAKVAEVYGYSTVPGWLPPR